MSDGYKLAVIFLDGVVTNTRERMMRFSTHARQLSDFYDPHLLHLDTLVDGAEDALNVLEDSFLFKVIYITTRPERIRNATIAWLLAHNVWFPGIRTSLIMRQEEDDRSDDAYIQQELQRLQTYYHPEQIIYIDPNPDRHPPYAHSYTSLHSCLANVVTFLLPNTPDAVNTATLKLEETISDKDYIFMRVKRAADVPELYSQTAGWVIYFRHKQKNDEIALLVWWEDEDYHVAPIYRIPCIAKGEVHESLR